jgi:hypothetical protein
VALGCMCNLKLRLQSVALGCMCNLWLSLQSVALGCMCRHSLTRDQDTLVAAALKLLCWAGAAKRWSQALYHLALAGSKLLCQAGAA